MCASRFYIAVILTLIVSCHNNVAAQASDTDSFNIANDLLLAHFDCKTDVDDIHSAAALKTLLSNEPYSMINYHAVAGTYGIQEGLYVPPNNLFQLTFGANWSDAHENRETALQEVMVKASILLEGQGGIWIAEAGQSDFSADLVRLLQAAFPNLDLSKRIHIVQHSDWNEKVTSPDKLSFVKEQINYHKIPDGNALDNGTPGFRTPDFKEWKSKVKDPRLVDIWQLAVTIGNRYNGKDGRYNNEAIAAGGLDFSDISEVCWILGIQEIKDTSEFFERFAGIEKH